MTASVSAEPVTTTADERENVHAAARRARTASRALALLTTAEKDTVLHAAADAVVAAAESVLAANAIDIENARAAGTGGASAVHQLLWCIVFYVMATLRR